MIIIADQNIQLMLVYTGMAADILEIFEAFRENKVNSDGGDDFKMLTHRLLANEF